MIELYDDKPENLNCSKNVNLEATISDRMEIISTECTNKMIELAAMMIKDAVGLMAAEPPCSYAAVALGSMAKLEATPYSDLEFLFLIEEHTSETEAYFEQLAINVYFLIGNLQETNLKYMNIEELEGWFKDKSKSGFKIDGLRANAGNIPTGNGEPQSKNKYICTVAYLLGRYRHIFQNPIAELKREDRPPELIGDESGLLAYVRLITSSCSEGDMLFTQLEDGIRDTELNDERRNVATLVLETDYCKHYIFPYMSLFNGSCMDVKSEIYRFPSMLVLNLKILQSVKSSSSWETLQQIKDIRIKDIRLRGVLSISMLIRLASYLYHDSQCERTSFLKVSQTNEDRLDKFKQWHISPKLFLMYFIARGPSECLYPAEEKDIIYWKNLTLSDKRLISALEVKVSLGGSCYGYVEKLSPQVFSNPPCLLACILTTFLNKNGNHKLAHKCLKDIEAQSADDEATQRAAILLWETATRSGMCRERRIYEERVTALLTSNSLISASHLVSMLWGLRFDGYRIPYDLTILSIHSLKSFIEAYYHFLLGDYKLSLEIFMECELQEDQNKGEESISLFQMTLLVQIGEVYLKLLAYDDCLETLKQAVITHMKFLDHQHDRIFADAFRLIGDCYLAKNEYVWASRAYRMALHIHDCTPPLTKSNGLTPNIAAIYDNLHIIYRQQNDLIRATLCKMRSDKIKRHLHIDCTCDYKQH